MSFNKIILVGNLGRDPELRYMADGTPVCSFSIATNERKKDRSGETQDVTTWFRVTLWGRQAETGSQYLTKGKAVYIEGRLRLGEWTDKEGKTRQSLEVRATDMQFISSRSDDGTSSGGSSENSPASGAARPQSTTPSMPEDESPVGDEDIPF